MIFRFILLTAFISVIPLLSFAQKPTPVPEDWRIFQPDNDEFTIETPLELKNYGMQDAKSSRMYFGSINGTYLYVFSDPVKSPDNLKVTIRFVNSSGKTLAENGDPAILTRLTFEDSYGYWQSIVIARSKTRIYVAQALSKNEKNPVANHFMSSFGLDSSKFYLPTETEKKPVEIVTPPISPQKGSGLGGGSGSGSGSGLGSGNGSGVGVGSPTKTFPQQLSPLKIQSKARPAYTDFARFYWITGTVILRITFLASGEIGSVTVVTDLPFGLTEQALIAARRIRFEPAYRDGSPITVSKAVEYSFLIY